MTTALEADEIITEIRLPAWPAKRRWGFQEFARRRGDFAMAAAALFYDQDASGKATNAHVGIIGCGDRPRRLAEVEAVLNGHAIDETTISRAAEVTSATVEAQEDIHASAAYRRSLAGVMVERALQAAAR
jgi:carbon-monoxide dehydrogenase medium subunit